ncbi:hypothetical protein [Streptomyces sp. NPDC005970]
MAGRCGCGCATVDLEVNRAAVPPAPEHGNPAADDLADLADQLGAI